MEHKLLRISTGGRLTSRLFTQRDPRSWTRDYRDKTEGRVEDFNHGSYRHLQVLCRYCQSASSRLSVKERERKKKQNHKYTWRAWQRYFCNSVVETEIAIIIHENLKVLTARNRWSKKNHNKEPLELEERGDKVKSAYKPSGPSGRSLFWCD